jgi:hypothetical protein
MMDSIVGWHSLAKRAKRLLTSRRIAPARPRAVLMPAGVHDGISRMVGDRLATRKILVNVGLNAWPAIGRLVYWDMGESGARLLWAFARGAPPGTSISGRALRVHDGLDRRLAFARQASEAPPYVPSDRPCPPTRRADAVWDS